MSFSHPFPLKVIHVAVGLTLLSFTCLCDAFDTGHHHDLTASAMKTLGFNSTAIKVAQLENFLVDYYSSQPLAGLESELTKLHFDNLEDSKRVAAYWARLTSNSKSAFEQASRDRDALRVLALLGMSLHALQDFYSHSNWVELHTLHDAGYLTDTYFDNQSAASGALRTGRYPNHSPILASDHGDGSSGAVGMNHDAYTRPHWDRAYVHAFCASRQWIGAARAWVEGVSGGKAVWLMAMELSLEAEDARKLDQDLAFAYRISEYAPGGHWKGPGSESRAEFAGAIAGFTASGESLFVKHLKESRWHELLTEGLDSTVPTASPPSIPPMTHEFVAVRIRTLHVAEQPVELLESKIDSAGKTDFYAKITIDGQIFIESMQMNSDSITPSWTSIAFIPRSQASVDIFYELWDEDGGARGEDELCDIHEAIGEKVLRLTLILRNESLTGDLRGVHNTEAVAAESRGMPPDKNRAKVKLMFAKETLSP